MLSVLRTGSWRAVDKKQCYGTVDKIRSVLSAHQLMFLASLPALHELAPGAGDDQRLLHLLS